MHQWKSCYSRSSRLETYVTGLVCRQHCSCLLERSLSSVSMSTSNPFSHPAITLPGQKMVHPSSQLILLYNNIRQAFFVAFFTILIKIVSKQKKGEKIPVCNRHLLPWFPHVIFGIFHIQHNNSRWLTAMLRSQEIVTWSPITHFCWVLWISSVTFTEIVPLRNSLFCLFVQQIVCSIHSCL